MSIFITNLLIYSLFATLARGASDTTAAGTTVTADNASSQSASGSTACSYDGSISTYLSCEKRTLSTTELIGGGLGVSAGIFIIAFAGIWLMQRNKRKRSTTAQNKKPSRDTRREEEEVGDEMEEIEEDEAHQVTEKEFEALRARRPTVEEVTDDEQPVPPNDEKAALKAAAKKNDSQTQQEANLGSPVQIAPVRNLYPSNPSPNPRHMTGEDGTSSNTNSPRGQSLRNTPPPSYPTGQLPPVPTARSQSRQSTISTRSRINPSPSHSPAPPMPENPSRPVPGRTRPPPSGSTQPLNIRKSTTSTIFPSYYGGSSVPPRPSSRASSRYQVKKGSDSSDSEPVPPLPPYSSRPSPNTAERVGRVIGSQNSAEVRRPSHSGSESGSGGRSREGSGSVGGRSPSRPAASGRRPSEGKGGMI